jgi:hypothetical protein
MKRREGGGERGDIDRERGEERRGAYFKHSNLY